MLYITHDVIYRKMPDSSDMFFKTWFWYFLFVVLKNIFIFVLFQNCFQFLNFFQLYFINSQDEFKTYSNKIILKINNHLKIKQYELLKSKYDDKNQIFEKKNESCFKNLNKNEKKTMNYQWNSFQNLQFFILFNQLLF